MTQSPVNSTGLAGIRASIVATQQTFRDDATQAGAQRDALKAAGDSGTAEIAAKQAEVTRQYGDSQSYGHLQDTLTSSASALDAVLAQIDALSGTPEPATPVTATTPTGTPVITSTDGQSAPVAPLADGIQAPLA